ncbi:MAG: PAS sensor protein [Lentimicrobium sp.]|jgi:DUF438 domain-containing protein|nr:PAS sensor protein [Lentimicrobium sp.]
MVEWLETLPVAITVSDKAGNIIDMNGYSQQVFQKYGGKHLIGKHLHPCHHPDSIAKMETMLSQGTANIYTIEKQGRKKMIFQAPWFKEGETAGLVEISIVLPEDMPHYVRD